MSSMFRLKAEELHPGGRGPVWNAWRRISSSRWESADLRDDAL